MKPAAVLVALSLVIASPALAYDPPPVPDAQIYVQAQQGDPDALQRRYASAPSYPALLAVGLLRAIVDKKIDRVRRFLDLGAGVGRPPAPHDYTTPLALAAAVDAKAIAALLASRGANPLEATNPGDGRKLSARVWSDYYVLVRRAEDAVMAAATAANDAAIEAEHEAQRRADEALLERRRASEAAALRAQEAEEAKERAHYEAIAREEAQRQLKAWDALVAAVKGRRHAAAREAYGELSGEVLTMVHDQSRETLAANVGAKRGQRVFLFAAYDGPAPGGAMMLLRGSPDRVFVTGVRAGQFVTGEELDMFAIVEGTYTYRTVAGAMATVPRVRLELAL